MSQPSDFDRTLRRIRLMLEEGQEEDALAQLDAIQADTPEQLKEINYIHARYSIQKELWNQAVSYLSLLYDAASIEDGWVDASHTERERRAFYLLWLGMAAVNLSRYEDASQHYTQCLKILQLRRVHLPRVRIKALIGLAMTCIPSGFYAVAIQHYQEALKVCSKEKLEHQLKKDMADIYHGLSDAYRLTGDFDRARTYGNMALQMYEELSERYFVGRMYNLLGRIAFHLGENQLAAEHYMESLSIATLDNRPGMQMVNFVAIADLRLSENRLDEAQRYCQRALEIAEQIQHDHHLCGMMYLVCGKVEQQKATLAQGQDARFHLEEALDIYKKAEKELTQTQATTHLSELYGRCAEVHEALNQPQAALTCWKTAFDVVANPKGTGWYE